MSLQLIVPRFLGDSIFSSTTIFQYICNYGMSFNETAFSVGRTCDREDEFFLTGCLCVTSIALLEILKDPLSRAGRSLKERNKRISCESSGVNFWVVIY